jgi:hypothetical protein
VIAVTSISSFPLRMAQGGSTTRTASTRSSPMDRSRITHRWPDTKPVSARTGSTSQAVAFTVPSAAGYGGGVLAACLDPSDQFSLVAAPKDLSPGNVHCWSNGTVVRLCRHPWGTGQGEGNTDPHIRICPGEQGGAAYEPETYQDSPPSTRQGPGIPGG